MDNGFRKIKQKARAGAILRSLLVGLSLGVIAVALQWLLAKLTAGQPDFVRYGIIGGGIALVTFLVLFLLQLPTDKRLARKLDKKLALDEKVQTMIAFRQDESDMVTLQRYDTERILSETPAKQLRNKWSWLLALVPVLACACMVVTVLVPVQAEEQPGEVDNTAWFLNLYDEQKLKDLIAYVDTSKMQEAPKAEVVTQLQDLLAKLKTVNKKADMQVTVVDTIAKIHEACKVCDNYSRIVAALESSVTDSVKLLGQNVSTLDDKFLVDHMAELLKTMTEGNRGEIAAPLASGITKALEATKLDATNPIYAALEAFATDLSGVTAETPDENLKAMLTKSEAALVKAVEQPGIDVGVEKYVINRLMAIFGIAATEIPSDILDTFENEITGDATKPEDQENEKGDQGGAGTGEQLFGSDDTIYDPELEAFVPYGEVINKYYSILSEYFADGTVPEDVEDMIADYFAILFRKTEEST